VIQRDDAVVAVKEGDLAEGKWIIKVGDTTKALGDIAKTYRTHFDIPVVAITGSNGKSTTKEMVASIASLKGETLKTEGNFNNLIGLPLTVFRMEKQHKVAILEMGMNAKGEIARLTEIANPTVGIITNVNPAHLEAAANHRKCGARQGRTL
jgi:UDP-N-acetylmuramoyl-tripeptide--D-alanyl-D-alanine ligase